MSSKTRIRKKNKGKEDQKIPGTGDIDSLEVCGSKHRYKKIPIFDILWHFFCTCRNSAMQCSAVQSSTVQCSAKSSAGFCGIVQCMTEPCNS